MSKRWIIIASLGILFVVLLALFLVFLMQPLPASSEEKVAVYDRHGYLLYSDIPYYQPTSKSALMDVGQLVVELEDRTFWNHRGVSFRGVVRALRDNIDRRSQISGASTITMQLAGLRYLQEEEHDLWYKIRQIFLAWKLEYHLTKEEILTEYLHRVYLGSGATGFPAASWRYFGKSLSSLSLDEQAVLIAILPRPEAWNPIRSIKNAKERRNHVLNILKKRELIDPSTEEQLSQLEINLKVQDQNPIHAPHFVFWVLDANQHEKGSYLNSIYTTLDLEVYQSTRRIVSSILEEQPDADLGQISAVAIDDDEIILMLGSMDFFDETNKGAINMATSKRHMGSTLKPFLFAYALENGFSPLSVIKDIKKGYAEEKGSYTPRNFDPKKQYGHVRFREALGGSYNLSSIDLLDQVGVHRWLDYLQSLGLDIEQSAHDVGLSLALGTGSSTLLDLATAYSVLFHQGMMKEIVATTEVIDMYENEVSEPRKSTPKQIMTPNTAQWITHALSDSQAKWSVYGQGSSLEFEFEVASKTGTSQDYRDHYVVGYSPEVVVGVWRGYPDGQPLVENENSQRIWHDIMQYIHTGEQDAFEYSWDRKPVHVCARPSQTLVHCDHAYTEYLLDSEKATPEILQSTFQITSPSDGDRYHNKSQIHIQTYGAQDPKSIRYFLDGDELSGPTISRLTPGNYTLQVTYKNHSDAVEFFVEESP